MPAIDLPTDLRFEEIATFLNVYERARSARPLQYPTFRDLFHGLGAHTTTLGHINRLLDAIFPPDLAGIPGQSGERLKLLFTEKPGVGLEPTGLADRLRTQFEPLTEFWKNLRASALAIAANRGVGDAVVRVGAPQTLTLRLLAYTCSKAAGIFIDAPGVRLDITAGDTERDLLPRLHLGTLDCIVGYGLPYGDAKEKKVVYTDPDDEEINFADLDSPFELVLIYHPEDRRELFGSLDESDSDHTQKRGAKKTPKARKAGFNPVNVNLRRTTLIAVPSWRQCEGVQDLIDRARRLGRLKEVETDDEALALVRCGCGIAIVPEVFRDRRVIDYVPLAPRRQYERRFGMYYSHRRAVSANTCQFGEFLRSYMKVYNEAKNKAHRGETVFEPPAYDEKKSPLFPNAVIEKLIAEYGPAPNWEELAKTLYPSITITYRPPTRDTPE